MSISANDKRRALKGHTHDPYECCGKEPESGYGRRKGQICHECRGLIEDGQRFRSEKKQQDLEVFMWTERDYGFPGYYGDYDFDHAMHRDDQRDHRDELEKALFELVNAVAIDAPSGTPRTSPKYEMREYAGTPRHRHYIPWPTVLSEEGSRHDSWSWNRLVLVNPGIRQAIDRLDQAIRVALTNVYNTGKANGASILKQLASGDMSLTDFEDGIVTREERAAREKARRGY